MDGQVLASRGLASKACTAPSVSAVEHTSATGRERRPGPSAAQRRRRSGRRAGSLGPACQERYRSASRDPAPWASSRVARPRHLKAPNRSNDRWRLSQTRRERSKRPDATNDPSSSQEVRAVSEMRVARAGIARARWRWDLRGRNSPACLAVQCSKGPSGEIVIESHHIPRFGAELHAH